MVNQAGDNFTVSKPVYETKQGGEGKEGRGQEVNSRWLAKNKLENESKLIIYKGRTTRPEEAPASEVQPGRKISSEASSVRAGGRTSLGPQTGRVQFGAGTHHNSDPFSESKSDAKSASAQPADAQPAAPKAFAANAPMPAKANATEALQERESAGKKSQRQLQRYTDRLARQQEQPGQVLSENRELEVSGRKDQAAGRGQMMGGGMGGMGFGNNALSVADAEGKDAPPSVPQADAASDLAITINKDAGAANLPHPAVLASLDVELHPRGTQYLFTTPRGDVVITARAVSASLVGRAIRLFVLAIGLALIVAAGRLWRTVGSSRSAASH